MAEAKLRAIHASLKFDHGKLADEMEEQLMAVAHVRPDARVLELGGNVGRNSCVIASLLNDSSNLVVFESDPANAALLVHNRDANGFRFAVESAALSKRALIQNAWDTRPYEGALPSGWQFVRTIAWADVVRKHGAFDTLVCDAEGALYYICADEPDFFRTFRTVILENDFTDINHKQYVDARMTAAGLRRVFHKAGGWGPCADRFYEVWTR